MCASLFEILRHPGAYGDDYTLRALADLFGMRVHVVSSLAPLAYDMVISPRQASPGFDVTIVFYDRALGPHYNATESLLQMDSITEEQSKTERQPGIGKQAKPTSTKQDSKKALVPTLPVDVRQRFSNPVESAKPAPRDKPVNNSRQLREPRVVARATGLQVHVHVELLDESRMAQSRPAGAGEAGSMVQTPNKGLGSAPHPGPKTFMWQTEDPSHFEQVPTKKARGTPHETPRVLAPKASQKKRQRKGGTTPSEREFEPSREQPSSMTQPQWPPMHDEQPSFGQPSRLPPDAQAGRRRPPEESSHESLVPSTVQGDNDDKRHNEHMHDVPLMSSLIQQQPYVAICASCETRVSEHEAGILHGCVGCMRPVHAIQAGAISCSMPALFVTSNASAPVNLKDWAHSEQGARYLNSQHASFVGAHTTIWLTSWCMPCCLAHARKMAGQAGLLATGTYEQLGGNAIYVSQENAIMATNPALRAKASKVFHIVYDARLHAFAAPPSTPEICN